jgi:hypothetical protein
LLLVTACGGAPAATLVTPTPGGSAPASPTPDGLVPTASAAAGGAGGPTLTLEQPKDGATVPAGKLTVGVKVAGIQLVNKIGQPAVPGEGHLIYYAGVDFIPTQPGRPATTAPQTYAPSDQPSSSWPSLAPGRYLVGVQIVNNDDTPLVPPVVVKATITISG